MFVQISFVIVGIYYVKKRRVIKKSLKREHLHAYKDFCAVKVSSVFQPLIPM